MLFFRTTKILKPKKKTQAYFLFAFPQTKAKAQWKIIGTRKERERSFNK